MTNKVAATRQEIKTEDTNEKPEPDDKKDMWASVTPGGSTHDLT